MGRWAFVATFLIAGCADLAEASSDDGTSSDGEGSTSDTPTTGPGDTGPAPMTSDGDASGSGDGSTTNPVGSECGNGEVEDAEMCDDGNDVDTDACSNACVAASCEDGVQNGDEEGIDCGGATCRSCGCDPACEPFEVCLERACVAAASCRDHAATGGRSGVYPIDPDADGANPPYDVVCDFDAFGGGWTLIATVSDDGGGTWTWNTRDLFTTNTSTVGTVADANSDFKSAALHDVAFEELYFLHMPSGITAVYDVTADESTHASVSAFMMTFAEPESWSVDSGFELVDGTLAVADGLCEDRLYINAADSDGNNFTHAAGPTWRARFNSPSCTNFFDDPGFSGTWGGRATNTNVEMATYGFGAALSANTGTDDASENYLQMWAR